MAKALITPPAGLPVSLAQVKEHLRIESVDEDAYLMELARAATAHVEALTGKTLIAQTWRIYFDEMPPDRIVVLPLTPVTSVAAVALYNADGTPEALLPPGYSLEAFRDPPRLVFAETVLADRAANGVEIDVVAGYGEAGEDVPGQFGRAILVLCAHWHGFRGAALDAAQAGVVPAGFDRLLAPYRQVRL